MRPFCALSFVMLSLPGCWAGGPIKATHIDFKHDSVVWVYEAGGQLGRWGLLLVPVENNLIELQPGEGCVHVTEGRTGGYCSAAPQADSQISHALDLKTGRSVSACGRMNPLDHPKPALGADDRGWILPVDSGLSVYSFSSRLYLRSPSQMLVLQLRHPDPEVTYEPNLGVPIAAFRMPEDLLVVGLDGGYVVCVDLRQMGTALQ